MSIGNQLGNVYGIGFILMQFILNIVSIMLPCDHFSNQILYLLCGFVLPNFGIGSFGATFSFGAIFKGKLLYSQEHVFKVILVSLYM
jgi:hypothetical protein